MGRIASLMVHYYIPNIPDVMQEAVAADWSRALAGKPAWAVARAVDWWLSAANERRRIRPVPGDIEARVECELVAVRAAEVILARPIVAAPAIEHTEEPRGEAIPIERRKELVRSLLGDAAVRMTTKTPNDNEEN